MSNRVKPKYDERMLERVTRSMPSITTDHEYIHEGGFFEVGHRFTMNAAGTAFLLLKTPAVKYVHYRNEKISTSGDKLTVELFEGPTITLAGTAITPVNHRRIHLVASDMVVQHTPTVGAEGTLLATSYLGGGTGQGQARAGDILTEQNEWVLKRGTDYLIKLTNGSAAQNIVQINPIWYEEENA
jgi:hypothetical protein